MCLQTASVMQFVGRRLGLVPTASNDTEEVYTSVRLVYYGADCGAHATIFRHRLLLMQEH